MAKALIAAVSLALVLVAAVVVPLVFMPGVFGFNDWPEAVPAAPREHVVTLDVPAAKTVVVDSKRRTHAAPKPAAAPHERPAQATPSPASPTAVGGSEQQEPQAQPAAPAAPAEPQAAPEAQPEPVVIDARDNAVPDDGSVDGTNLP